MLTFRYSLIVQFAARTDKRMLGQDSLTACPNFGPWYAQLTNTDSAIRVQRLLFSAGGFRKHFTSQSFVVYLRVRLNLQVFNDRPPSALRS